jgi:hypothetical protein
MIKNFYTANTAEPGDVFVCIVTCHISEMGYKLYRCNWPPRVETEQEIPQGSAMYDTHETVKQLFPIVSNLGIPERS